MKTVEYDVIVIGAGHAGCEAALASARMGCNTLCLTTGLDNVALMPCNPSVGGPAKGHLVREIDALGGQMGVTTDLTYIQIKELNTSKGSAVRALRAQVDKGAYHRYMKNVLEEQPLLTLRQDTVERLIFKKGQILGVVCRGDVRLFSKAVVITTGTFLRSTIYVGKVNYSGGPQGQLGADKLSLSLAELGITLQRFKTGTPARVNARSIDFSKMVEQPGDKLRHGFSFLDLDIAKNNVSCWLTYTNSDTHEIISSNLHSAPVFTGDITGVGPRYCPSIESKVVTFPEKDRHQVFLEPESIRGREYYLGGLSTSLPIEAQECFLKTICGLEKVEILRYGYAIEYDVIMPSQLSLWLEVKHLPNLFSAGQVNGTSGYEEAAAQGIVAGINAARRALGKEPVILRRDEAYIGVMIDDLVSKGIDEPYRMLTTRAEFRLTLRHDNADLRLTRKGRELGLVSDHRMRLFEEKTTDIKEEYERVRNTSVKKIDEIGTESIKLSDYLKRPGVSLKTTLMLDPGRLDIDDDVAEQVELNIKYEGYIKKQLDQISKVNKYEAKEIGDVDYTMVPGLSSEARQKLHKTQPKTLGQAARIPGVTPADITSLMLFLTGRKGTE